jgi:type I restriction enzyme, S subunit
MPEPRGSALAAAPRRFRRYPDYKDSGVEWLGEIPAHWEVRRAKQVAGVNMGQSPHSQLYNENGDGLPFLQGNADFGAEHPTPRIYCPDPPKRAKQGDLLLSVRAPVGAINSADQEYGIGRGLCALTVGRHADHRFFRYLLETARWELASAATGSTYEAVAAQEIGQLSCVLPTLQEQSAIAAFLDRETARIDSLVAKKERLIELLQEKRTALITRAVTRGLDPTVPMKDSSVEWLGEIPAHWEVKRLMFITEIGHPIMYGIVLPGPHFDGGVPIVKGGDVAAEKLRRDLLRCTDLEIEAAYERSRLREGDLVYAIRGSIGAVEMVPADVAGANITQDAAKIAPHHSVHRRWLLFALRSTRVFAQLDAGSLGATVQGINIRDLKRCRLPIPPRGEQEAVAVSLDRETASVGKLIDKVSEGIDQLKEYRSALISAAVTGKIDVREEVATG